MISQVMLAILLLGYASAFIMIPLTQGEPDDEQSLPVERRSERTFSVLLFLERISHL